mmetsp:Transcript_164/g.417  ORF Transcript_164/g.417 Transcript_164/m.417 type:complete len:261 (+) Transcript_164:42-824(+)
MPLGGARLRAALLLVAAGAAAAAQHTVGVGPEFFQSPVVTPGVAAVETATSVATEAHKPSLAETGASAAAAQVEAAPQPVAPIAAQPLKLGRASSSKRLEEVTASAKQIFSLVAAGATAAAKQAGLDEAASAVRSVREAARSSIVPEVPVDRTAHAVHPGAMNFFRAAAHSNEPVQPRPIAMVSLSGNATKVKVAPAKPSEPPRPLTLEEQQARLAAVLKAQEQRQADEQRQRELEQQSLLESAMSTVREERRPGLALLG